MLNYCNQLRYKIAPDFTDSLTVLYQLASVCNEWSDADVFVKLHHRYKWYHFWSICFHSCAKSAAIFLDNYICFEEKTESLRQNKYWLPFFIESIRPWIFQKVKVESEIRYLMTYGQFPIKTSQKLVLIDALDLHLCLCLCL